MAERRLKAIRGTEHSRALRDIQQYLGWAGAWHVNLRGGLYQRNGVPDMLACLSGRFVAIEVKIKPDKLSDTQLVERSHLEAAMAVYIVAAGVQDVEDGLIWAGLLAGPLSLSARQQEQWRLGVREPE